MIEIGTWRGDRSVQFISSIPTLERFVGIDLFEDMDDEIFEYESMGQCYPATREAVEARLMQCDRSSACAIELIKGATEGILPLYALEHEHEFDLIYIDGGHSLETVENDWKYGLKLLAHDGTAILDDYYLNDDSIGVKNLVDRLTAMSDFDVTFFPMIEDIIDGLQITMVSIKRASGTDR